MQRRHVGKAIRYLVVVGALVSAFAMVGCGGGGGDDGGSTVSSGETISSVNSGAVTLNSSNVQSVVGQQFTIPNGSIFDPSIGNNSAAFTFTSSSQFSLGSKGSTASGSDTFGSCTLTYTVSNFPAGQGPQVGASIKFDPCTIQVTASNVTVGGGATGGTLTLTLSGPFGSSTSSIVVQVSILANGTLVVNGVSTGITISSNGTPVTTGTTGTGGTP